MRKQLLKAEMRQARADAAEQRRKAEEARVVAEAIEKVVCCVGFSDKDSLR